MLDMKALDYYEFLQISPNADPDTIHRVYRFLAARYHPDHPTSADPEKFEVLRIAYEVLSDPTRRAAYDASYQNEGPSRPPLSASVDFMDNFNGELNRRLAILAVLYYRRRTNPHNPEVGLPEIERRMGFPRDYLDFTTWYLLRKGYITRADNSDFTLTAHGVDFVETQRANIPTLNKLLTNGSERAAEFDDARALDTSEVPVAAGSAPDADASAETRPVIVLPDLAGAGSGRSERRGSRSDRRIGLPDNRADKVERRVAIFDRRSNG
jgi:curved DNA-binding protein CbpA